MSTPGLTPAPLMNPAPMRPVVATMFRLQFEPAQGSWVLLYPEGMVKLNTPAAEILRRCDGARSVDEIVAELEVAFGQAALHDDVCAFLSQARQRGWVQ
jgi:pyrroloquinoline quinone biosynthesis protein D